MQSEERLRTITDNLPALVGYVDASRHFRFNNNAYEKWLRKPRDEITGYKLSEVYSEDIYRLIEPNVEKALPGERVQFDFEFLTDRNLTRHVRGVYIGVPSFLVQ